MVAQTSEKRNHEQPSSTEWRLPEVHAKLASLVEWIDRSAQDGTSAHAVERGLFEELLALGKMLFQGFLTLIGPGDFGKTITLDDGRRVHRAEEQHRRHLSTVFG